MGSVTITPAEAEGVRNGVLVSAEQITRAKRVDIEPTLLPLLLRYDAATGEMYWRERGPEWFVAAPEPEAACARWNSSRADKTALAYINYRGYKRGSILGRCYLAHRVVWALCAGHWPENVIDHLNRDKADNRFENLRHVTHTVNGRNKPLDYRNKSGVTGVSWERGRQKWIAHITVNGRSRNLGRYDDKNDAIRARKIAEREFGFHENHGAEVAR